MKRELIKKGQGKKVRWFSLVFILLFIASCKAGIEPAAFDISSSSINPGAENVSVGSDAAFTFVEEVNLESVTQNTAFVVSANDPGGCETGAKVPAWVECTSGTDCSVNPAQPFDQCAQYLLRLTSGITSAAGIPLTASTIQFSTICCATLFAGPGCTWDSVPVDPDPSETITYSSLLEAQDILNWQSGAAACICTEAFKAGETGCISVEHGLISAPLCGVDTSGTGGGGNTFETRLVHVDNVGNPAEDGKVYTVDIYSDAPVIPLYINYEEEAGEDISNVQYLIYANDEEIMCGSGTSCWYWSGGGYPYPGCTGQSGCFVQITGTQIYEALSFWGKLDEFLGTRINPQPLCVYTYWEWNAMGIDTAVEPGDAVSSNLLLVRLQSADGICQ